MTTDFREPDAYDTWSTVTEPEPEPPDHYRWPAPPGSKAERLPWVNWLYSLTLPVAMWLIVVTVFLQIRYEPDLITFTVTDSSTDMPIPSAELIVDHVIYRADENGEVTIRPPAVGSTMLVRAEGYREVRGSFLEGASRQQRVSLREATLIGTVVGDASGNPIVGARVFVTDAEGNVGSHTSTDEGGDFRLVSLPDSAILHVEADGFISTSIEVGTRESVTVTLTAEGSSLGEDLDFASRSHHRIRPFTSLLQPNRQLAIEDFDG